jgi:hypothetical protein
VQQSLTKKKRPSVSPRKPAQVLACRRVESSMTAVTVRRQSESFNDAPKNASADVAPQASSSGASTELERERFLAASASEEVMAALSVVCPTLIRPLTIVIAIFCGTLLSLSLSLSL